MLAEESEGAVWTTIYGGNPLLESLSSVSTKISRNVKLKCRLVIAPSIFPKVDIFTIFDNYPKEAFNSSPGHGRNMRY